MTLTKLLLWFWALSLLKLGRRTLHNSNHTRPISCTTVSLKMCLPNSCWVTNIANIRSHPFFPNIHSEMSIYQDNYQEMTVSKMTGKMHILQFSDIVLMAQQVGLHSHLSHDLEHLASPSLWCGVIQADAIQLLVANLKSAICRLLVTSKNDITIKRSRSRKSYLTLHMVPL